MTGVLLLAAALIGFAVGLIFRDLARGSGGRRGLIDLTGLRPRRRQWLEPSRPFLYVVPRAEDGSRGKGGKL